jgi:tetraacyldisaccharide 4'-kinase
MAEKIFRFFWNLLIPIRFLISLLYLAGFTINQHRIREKKISGLKIISIGNLSLGGTGKTPFTAYLAKKLNNHYNIIPAILMRGYKSPLENNEKKVNILDLTGFYPQFSVKEQNPGDEARLYINQNIPALLGIGKNRYINGTEIQKLGIKYAILDDGFQHHALARDLEFMLLDTIRPTAGGLIPLGKRRSPLRHLKKASVIIFSRWDQAKETERKKALQIIGKYAPDKPYFRAMHILETPYPLFSGAKSKNIFPDKEHTEVLVLCAIGNPESFVKSLEKDLKLKIKKSYFFRDHHHFTFSDLKPLLKNPDNQIVMTEKDSVKIKVCCNHELSQAAKLNFWVVPVKWQFWSSDEKKFLNFLDSVIQ